MKVFYTCEYCLDQIDEEELSVEEIGNIISADSLTGSGSGDIIKMPHIPETLFVKLICHQCRYELEEKDGFRTYKSTVH